MKINQHTYFTPQNSSCKTNDQKRKTENLFSSEIMTKATCHMNRSPKFYSLTGTTAPLNSLRMNSWIFSERNTSTNVLIASLFSSFLFTATTFT